MASMHVLKPAVTPISISQSKIPGKFSCFSMGKRNFKLHSYGRLSCFVSRRCRVCCSSEDDNGQSNGEEPPESLFMKELRRRGITPTSLLEDSKRFDSELEDKIKMENENRDPMRTAVSKEPGKSVSDQRERSMALNSEGLEGLVPRAKLLLTLGGTFFLAFWPLILITVAFFSALYLYFGPGFVHDASKLSVSPPQYIDPYALLEDERISQMARGIN